MSGLYNNNSSYFSPARAASPQIRSTPEIDSSQYLTELLAEHQKLTPFMQVLPICSRLLNQDMCDHKHQSKLHYCFVFHLLYIDESQDFIKRQQLRELALLNSNNLREESPGPSGGGSVSPFNSSGKRPKTGC
ncbi:hypothetical protein F2Q69_00010956 [Brassica cretica]|uniref:STAR protein homodimerisation region domain-containing protein n=1 Tax=Brassica cretica TaxID=69181 RepID=A0A8S9QU15_BRACR|nr:hypothetical protein F2Q69_00010956 [Brassica cretica]